MQIFDLLNFGIALLVMTDPFGTLPIFMSYTADASPRVQRLLALFVGVAVFVLFLIFLIFGELILSVFSISIPAFRIAGGLILLRISFSMMSGTLDTGATHEKGQPKAEETTDMDDAKFRFGKLVIPVIMPMLVGPGTISLVIVFAHRIPDIGIEIELIVAMAFVCLLVAIILLGGDWIQRMLGDTGLNIMTQVFALITAAIAIQFILVGLADVTIGLINPEALSVHSPLSQ